MPDTEHPQRPLHLVSDKQLSSLAPARSESPQLRVLPGSQRRASKIWMVPFLSIGAWMLVVVILWCIVMLVGCASIVNSQLQDVGISSTPPGSTVYVDDQGYVTPTIVRLERDQAFTLVFTKEGYEQSSMTLTRRLSPWVLGNVLLFPPVGTVIGVLVDSYTGALWTLQPETVHVVMRKDTGG